MAERKDLSLICGAADLAGHVLVKMHTDQTAIVNTATATDLVLGVTKANAKIGEPVPIKPLNAEGTVEIMAGGVIGAGAEVYAGADGKVTALPVGAADYRKIGIAMQAASGDGSIIEVLPVDHVTVTTVT